MSTGTNNTELAASAAQAQQAGSANAGSKKEITLLPQQQKALKAMQEFCNGRNGVFILKGYAGTGKTTLMKVFTAWLTNSKNFKNAATLSAAMRYKDGSQFVALASTGRAAKVLSDKIGQPACTVHSWIYSYKGFNQDLDKMTETIEKNNGVDSTGQLLLQFAFEPLEESPVETIYIIDESSMISDTKELNPTQAIFGSGQLLKDLLEFDPFGKFIFIGDECQLPPVTGTTSPALTPDYITSNYHLPVSVATLTEIVRQQSDNDIIQAADRMRRLCLNPPAVKWGKFPFRGYRHIKIVNSQRELDEMYVDEIKKHGYNATTLITGSNKSCMLITHSVRPQLGFTSPQLMPGELLLVTQNNITTGLMNGDLVKVVSVGNRTRRANLTFLEVEVEETATGATFNTMLIEELLYSIYTNLSQRQQKALFIDFYYREKEKHIKPKNPQFDEDQRDDPYLNALRAVYGYAITCHKSQGGEWPLVFLDIPRRISHESKSTDYQWLYTAMTRASDTLVVVNDFYIS